MLRLFYFLSLSFLVFSQRLFPRQTTPNCTSEGVCNTGTDLVQWDHLSFIINGERRIIWSGEFHPWRLPVPDLWRDILQKFKAVGFNTVSTYVHWGASNPTEGRVELDAWRDYELFLKMAQEAGLWVIARPGPYINGETSAGGIPGRVTNIPGFLRSNDSDYFSSYQQYYRNVVSIVKRYQINEGGPVILFQVDNEYTNNTNFATSDPVTKNEYMQALEDILHELGIVVPLISNDSYMGRNFAPRAGSTRIGEVDVYAMDSYPQGSCATPTLWSGFPVGYWDYHQSVNPTQPWIMPEFQGGSFLGWGPNSPTYEQCNTLTGVDFEQVYYLNQFATGVRGQNVYMAFGGTSWGFFPFPGVYTSYDYGASIAEDRTLTRKYYELKNLGMFVQSAEHDLARATNVSQIGDVTSPPTGYVVPEDPGVFVTELRTDEGKGFYIARQLRTSSFDRKTFKLRVQTSAGTFIVPQTPDVFITLDGRQSRAIVTDHSSKVLYSTASLFYSGRVGKRDVLVFHGPAGQSFEIALKDNTTFDFSSANGLQVQAQVNDNHAILTYTPSVGQTAVSISNEAVVILGDASAMDTFYALNEVLITGPVLLRNATVSSDGKTLRLVGDTNSTSTEFRAYAPETVLSITWNGQLQHTTPIAPGILDFNFTVAPLDVQVPGLMNWRFADGLPEIQPEFDDSKWVDADKESSTNPFDKYYGRYYLYACEYGFCEGPVLWRGHFIGEGTEKGVNLSITGGRAFAGSVWLNDVFLGSTQGVSKNNDPSAIIETTNETYPFPSKSISQGKDNMITVLHDNMGMEEARANQFPEYIKTPRGIQGYYLLGASDTNQPKWKVQGKLGGFSEFPDRTRGIMNEGGTFGERSGWHLPGFDDSKWNSTSKLDIGEPGVRVFRTTFELNVPEGLDVAISVEFPPATKETGKGYRAFLYVNGWNMGRYVADMGPQNKFAVPEGILDYRGVNTIAIVLWAISSSGAEIETLNLSIDRVHAGGVGRVAVNNPVWEKRNVV